MILNEAYDLPNLSHLVIDARSASKEREDPVPPSGTAKWRFVGPESADPNGDPGLLNGTGTEMGFFHVIVRSSILDGM
jgi:hypothetical protein